MNDLLTALVESRTVDAHLSQDAGQLVLTMHHDLPCSPEEAFALISDPAQTSLWSPVIADRMLDSVGAATSRESADVDAVDAEVIAVDPPRTLRHRWGGDVLDWEVKAHESGSRVILRDILADPTTASANAAGWHLCFASLEARAGGREVDRPVGASAHGYGWEQLRDGYDVLFANQLHG